MHTCVYERIFKCVHSYKYMYMWVSVRARACVRACVRVCVCKRITYNPVRLRLSLRSMASRRSVRCRRFQLSCHDDIHILQPDYTVPLCSRRRSTLGAPTRTTLGSQSESPRQMSCRRRPQHLCCASSRIFQRILQR